MIRILWISIIIICATGCFQKTEIQLHCNFSPLLDLTSKTERNFLLDIDENVVFDINDTDSRKGKLFITNAMYTFVFPAKPLKEYASIMGEFFKINRISGVSSIEQGNPPYEQGNNYMLYGTCKQIPIKRM